MYEEIGEKYACKNLNTILWFNISVQNYRNAKTQSFTMSCFQTLFVSQKKNQNSQGVQNQTLLQHNFLQLIECFWKFEQKEERNIFIMRKCCFLLHAEIWFYYLQMVYMKVINSKEHVTLFQNKIFDIVDVDKIMIM